MGPNSGWEGVNSRVPPQTKSQEAETQSGARGGCVHAGGPWVGSHAPWSSWKLQDPQRSLPGTGQDDARYHWRSWPWGLKAAGFPCMMVKILGSPQPQTDGSLHRKAFPQVCCHLFSASRMNSSNSRKADQKQFPQIRMPLQFGADKKRSPCSVVMAERLDWQSCWWYGLPWSKIMEKSLGFFLHHRYE